MITNSIKSSSSRHFHHLVKIMFKFIHTSNLYLRVPLPPPPHPYHVSIKNVLQSFPESWAKILVEMISVPARACCWSPVPWRPQTSWRAPHPAVSSWPPCPPASPVSSASCHRPPGWPALPPSWGGTC